MSEPIVRQTPQMPAVAMRLAWALLAIAGTVLAVALASWQLDRAAQKRAISQEIEDKKKLPALTDRDVLAIDSVAKNAASSTPVKVPDSSESAALLQRTAVLSGRWLHAYTVYLQNRPMDRKQGFYVVTPLQLRITTTDQAAEKTPVIMVQRGWVARDFQDINRLPPVVETNNEVQVRGRLVLQASTIFNLSTQNQTGNRVGAETVDPRMRHNLDTADFSKTTGLSVVPWVLLQTDVDSDGLKRAWPAVDSGVDKHYGYAFQWFSLSVLITALWVWFQWIAPRRRLLADSGGLAAGKSEQQGSTDAE